MKGGTRGVVVQGGAAATLDRVVLSGLAVCGMLVEGEGSTLEVSNSHIKEFSSRFFITTDTTAVLAQSGGAATLDGVCMTGPLACWGTCKRWRVCKSERLRLHSHATILSGGRGPLEGGSEAVHSVCGWRGRHRSERQG